MAPNWNSHLNSRVCREVSRRNILEQDRKDNEEWYYHYRAWNSDLNRRVRRNVEFHLNLETKEKIVREQIIERSKQEPIVEHNDIIIKDEEERQNDTHVHVISDEDDQAHFFRIAKRQITVNEKINIIKKKTTT